MQKLKMLWQSFLWFWIGGEKKVEKIPKIMSTIRLHSNARTNDIHECSTIYSLKTKTKNKSPSKVYFCKTHSSPLPGESSNNVIPYFLNCATVHRIIGIGLGKPSKKSPIVETLIQQVGVSPEGWYVPTYLFGYFFQRVKT